MQFNTFIVVHDCVSLTIANRDELVVSQELDADLDDGCDHGSAHADQKADDPARKPLPPNALRTPKQ